MEKAALRFCRASDSQCGGQGFDRLLLHHLVSIIYGCRHRRPYLICGAQEAVSSAEQVLVCAGLNATGAVLARNPKDVILEDAQKWDADLITAGSHGRRGFKRFLLGN